MQSLSLCLSASLSQTCRGTTARYTYTYTYRHQQSREQCSALALTEGFHRSRYRSSEGQSPPGALLPCAVGIQGGRWGGLSTECLKDTKRHLWLPHYNNPSLLPNSHHNTAMHSTCFANRVSLPITELHQANGATEWQLNVIPAASSYDSCSVGGVSTIVDGNQIVFAVY